jgi:hypothetical protein
MLPVSPDFLIARSLNVYLFTILTSFSTITVNPELLKNSFSSLYNLGS